MVVWSYLEPRVYCWLAVLQGGAGWRWWRGLDDVGGPIMVILVMVRATVRMKMVGRSAGCG